MHRERENRIKKQRIKRTIVNKRKITLNEIKWDGEKRVIYRKDLETKRIKKNYGINEKERKKAKNKDVK